MHSWTINLKPFPDELLSSWLIRTAIANGSDPMSLTGTIWDKWRPWTVDIDRVIPDKKMLQLSFASNLPIDTLKSMTLEPIIEQILGGYKLNHSLPWPWVIPTGNRGRVHTNGLHFCSKCLKNPPIYFKQSWRLSWNTVCSKHHILLSIACPDCGTVVSPHLVTFQNTALEKCINCNYDLTQSPVIKASQSVIQLQSRLNTAAFNQHSTIKYPLNISGTKELFEVLHFLMIFLHTAYKKALPFQALFTELNVNIDKMNLSHSRGSNFESYSALERYYLMLSASKILSMPHTKVIQLFIQAGITKQMLNVSKDKPQLITNISKKLIDNPRKRKANIREKEAIKPRQKSEVDVMMNEIQQHL